MQGLPPPALLRVLSMLNQFPERHRAQMVCRSWHNAAQHQSLFLKISASDFDIGSRNPLAKVLAKVAPGGTVLFGPGVYQLNETLEISKPLRLLAIPDTHVELQMISCRAQLRWSARGGVICGFHFTRINNAFESTAIDFTPSSDATKPVSVVKESRHAVRNRDKKLGNWQNLLRVEGNGKLRVEYCEFDGNGLGNACICVWGRGEKKKKKKKAKNKREIAEYTDTKIISASNPGTLLAAAPVSSTPMANTTGVSATTASTPSGTTACKTVALSVAPKSASDTTRSVASTACVTTPMTTTSSLIVTENVTSPATAQVSVTTTARPSVSTQTAAAVGLLPNRPVVCTSAAAIPQVSTPSSLMTTTPRNVAAPPATVTTPAADTLLVLQNCRIRGAGSSGVLLMRGSLIMSLNTVEGNAHSGITILGGQALLRRNKVQRNARFGLRLLYHAGNVIVEDNAMYGNACGNFDADNSGRRFVVRLNDMDKEKEVPRAPVPVVEPVISASAEYWKRQRAIGAAASAASPMMPKESSAAISTRPVIASNIVRAGIPMGFMRPVVFPQGSNPLHVSHLPMAFASLGATPAISSVALNRPATSAQIPTATTTLQCADSVPGAASSVSVRPDMLSATTSAPTTTCTTSSLELQKVRQKRRPKMQQLVVGGREIVLQDTCEKPTEKLKFAPGSTAAAVAAAMSAMMANTAKLQAEASQAQSGGITFGNTATAKPMASTVALKAATAKPMDSVARSSQTGSVVSRGSINVTSTPSTSMLSPVQTSRNPTAVTKSAVHTMTPSIGTKVATPAAEAPSIKAVAAQSIEYPTQSAKSFGRGNNGQPGNKWRYEIFDFLEQDDHKLQCISSL
ncbi:unnamed protein product [Peronospora belbahrii]|uniref:F-box domain-containing protein n=1 Tax=Peronospora belbahrii TaxID=622444 RepID=A0ABN8CTN9_9STRA|nr:unnamed protein product [Peronospora belbahrii]